ncbi:MAG TPA: hypothetical protein ENK57_13365 [Polyangiaceae bacterium]|nr:hypothetical protein [Polyangiaceae bacterium]
MWRLGLFFALLASGCASNVGPDGIAVGGPCADEFDCLTGSYCLRGFDYPSGVCTTNCRASADCRGESVCADVEGGVCLLSCAVDEDCARTGYSCRELDMRGATGRVSACTGR